MFPKQTPENLLTGFFLNGVYLNNKLQLHGPGHGSEGNSSLSDLRLICTVNSSEHVRDSGSNSCRTWEDSENFSLKFLFDSVTSDIGDSLNF